MPPIVPYISPNPANGVERAALPGARLGVQADPSAFGAPIARGVADVADVNQSIFLQERAKARQVREQDWSNRLAAHENALLYDPQTGALQKRGKDAFGIADPVLGDFDTFAGQLDGEAHDEDERAALRNLVADRRNGVQRTVMGHIAGEMQAFDTQAFGSGIASSQSAALANYTDSSRVDEEAYRQLGAIEQYAQRHGLPQEWVQEQQSKAQSTTYAGVVGRMLDRGDDLAAKDAMKRWGDALTGEDAARIDGAMRESSSRSESRRRADAILTDAPDLQTALAGLEKAGIADTDLYDKTKARLVDHFQLAKAAENEHQADLFDSATLAIDQADNPADAAAVPATTWSTLQPKFKRELLAYQAAKAKGVPIQTDWNTWTDLRTLASSPEMREDFLATDLREYRSKLSDTDYRQLVDIQADVRENGSKSADKLGEWASFDEVVNRRLVDAKIDPTNNLKNADAGRANAFREQVGKAVAREQMRTGKKLSTDEVGKVADQLLIENTVLTSRARFSPIRLFDDGFSEHQVRSFEIPGAAATFDDIPTDKRDAIVARFQQRQQRKPTATEVVGIYNSTLAGSPNGK